MISTPQFSKMKDGVVIVNTARGAVIDEAALVKALSDGKVFSAGLDVYEEEPKIHQGLVDNSHVLLLPHMGTWTVSFTPGITYDMLTHRSMRRKKRWNTSLWQMLEVHWRQEN